MDKYDWKTYDLTSDGQFACRYCKGTKQMGSPLGSNNLVKCWMCNGSGYMIDVIMTDLRREQDHHNSTRQELQELKDWIRQTSTCKTCGGNQGKTLGGMSCKECGLEGKCPWGG